MHLSPREINKLLLHNAGFLAQKRYARGVLLNYVETIALISAQVLEFIRDGDSVAQLMEKGKGILGFADVMEGVASMVEEVQVEGTFPDGTKLVTIHHPVCREEGDSFLALYGSGLTRRTTDKRPGTDLPPLKEGGTVLDPGQRLPGEGTITLNAGREAVEVYVVNHGDRPVQVGSHYPFFETNPSLMFDRGLAFGKRLDIPAGTAVRFEPGEGKKVTLVNLGGKGWVAGGNDLSGGPTGPEYREAALQRAKDRGFSHKEGQ